MRVSIALVIFSVCCTESQPLFSNTALTGEQTRLHCPFGGGAVRNLFWNYWTGYNWTQIITFFKGDINLSSTYSEDRIELNTTDYSFLIKDVVIADEGLYVCDVDRKNTSPVLNISTQLSVISRPVEPFPSIYQCHEDSETNCVIKRAKGTVLNLTCSLTEFYPPSNISLTWRMEEGRIVAPSLRNQPRNEDGSFNLIIMIEIEVSREETYICEAVSTYLFGRNIHSRSASIQIQEGTGNQGGGLPAGAVPAIIGCSLLLLLVVVVVITLIHNRRRRCNDDDHRSHGEDIEGDGEENCSDREDVGVNLLRPNFEGILRKLAKSIPSDEHVHDLGSEMDFDRAQIMRYLAMNRKDGIVTAEGTAQMLFDWKQKVSPESERKQLRDVLLNVNLLNLADTYVPQD